MSCPTSSLLQCSHLSPLPGNFFQLCLGDCCTSTCGIKVPKTRRKNWKSSFEGLAKTNHSPQFWFCTSRHVDDVTLPENADLEPISAVAMIPQLQATMLTDCGSHSQVLLPPENSKDGAVVLTCGLQPPGKPLPQKMFTYDS